jgi:hypothetical protein
MAKSKQDYFAMGQKDFIGAYKQNNRYAIARRAAYFESDSWQALAYFEGYQAAGRLYWDSLAVVAAQLRANRPIHECLNLEAVDLEISSGRDLSSLAQTVAQMMDAINTVKRVALVSESRTRAMLQRNRAWSENALDVRAFHAFALTCDKDGNALVERVAATLQSYLRNSREEITHVGAAFRALYGIERGLSKCKP